MADERPEYVHCVRTGMYVNDKPETKSWCGRDTAREFAFTDAAHASLLTKSRLMICPECSKAIIEQLQKLTYNA